MRLLLLASTFVTAVAGGAHADVVFSQNFNDPAFRGASIGLTGSDLTSDRWASTTYYFGNSANGITLDGPAYLARNNDDPADQAVLLNEGGSSLSFQLSNLVQGLMYNLSFLLSGDNVPGLGYSGYAAVNGSTILEFSGIDGAPGSTSGVAELVSFVAAGTTATVRIGENSRTSASPIIDNIIVTSVPEPASLILVGAGLLGAGFARRRRSHA